MYGGTTTYVSVVSYFQVLLTEAGVGIPRRYMIHLMMEPCFCDNEKEEKSKKNQKMMLELIN